MSNLIVREYRNLMDQPGQLASAGAVFSDCERYRYRLWRTWDRRKPVVLFVMLNPSTADALVLDPTVRRCMDFAHQWDYGGLLVGNLFGYRATKPSALYAAARDPRLHFNPIGRDDDAALCDMAREAKTTVCAWGVHGELLQRGHAVTILLLRSLVSLSCLGRTKMGQPKHPLYLRSTQRLESYP